MGQELKRVSINSDIAVKPAGIDEKVWQLFKQKRENERQQIERDERVTGQ